MLTTRYKPLNLDLEVALQTAGDYLRYIMMMSDGLPAELPAELLNIILDGNTGLFHDTILDIWRGR